MNNESNWIIIIVNLYYNLIRNEIIVLREEVNCCSNRSFFSHDTKVLPSYWGTGKGLDLCNKQNIDGKKNSYLDIRYICDPNCRMPNLPHEFWSRWICQQTDEI